MIGADDVTTTRRVWLRNALGAVGGGAVGATAGAATPATPASAHGGGAHPAAGASPPAAARCATAPRRPVVRPPRLKPGDTIALINPSGAVFEREPYDVATETLRALGFAVREAPHLRHRRGHFAGADADRAADINALFADPTVHGLLALAGGSGGHRVLPRLDWATIARRPKFFGGFSDLTSLVNAVHAHTGLVTFHCPLGVSQWNAFSVEQFRTVVVDAAAPTLRNAPETDDAVVPKAGRTRTIRGGRARGPLVGGNLAVFASLAGSGHWPALDGAILFLEEVNEYIYRCDRMLGTLALAGAFDRLAGVVVGAFTRCEPGDGYGTLTLDEVFDDWFLPLDVPVYRGASFGHVAKKWTLPIGIDAEIDADAGTLRLLQPAVV